MNQKFFHCTREHLSSNRFQNGRLCMRKSLKARSDFKESWAFMLRGQPQLKRSRRMAAGEISNITYKRLPGCSGCQRKRRILWSTFKKKKHPQFSKTSRSNSSHSSTFPGLIQFWTVRDPGRFSVTLRDNSQSISWFKSTAESTWKHQINVCGHSSPRTVVG